MPPDRIDTAIAAADAEPEEWTQVSLTIGSTGRVIPVGLPDNLTESELLELVGWLTTVRRDAARQYAAAHARPVLSIARSLPQRLTS